MRISMTAAAAALVAIASAAPGLAFESTATGFKIELPPPYTFTPMKDTYNDIAIAILPVAGGPQAVMGMPQLCGVAFQAHPANQPAITQAEIDASIAGPSFLRDAGVNEKLWGENTQTSYSLASGASGLEVFGPMAEDPTITFYMTLARSPAGVATMTCVYETAVSATALPLFRQFRDAMTLPN
jgi:hypothetical protein